MTHKATCGLVPASPSARILVPSRDHEKRAQRKQKFGGTESVRVSPVSIRRMRIAVESLYATYLPSGEMAANTTGSSIGFVVICLSVTVGVSARPPPGA